MIYNFYQDTKCGIAGVSVISCGHIFAKSGRMIDRPEGRGDFLLFYVAKGREHFFLDGERVAEEGSFIFFRPRESQRHIYRGETTGEFYYIHFSAPSDFDLFGFESSRVYNSEPSAAIVDAFEEIMSELRRKETAYERLSAAKLFTLISLLERKTRCGSSAEGRYFNEISFVIQNMNKEYYENYTLMDYSAMCKMSKYHFIRVFKEITGLSPLEYRNKVRLDHTKVQLRDTNIPISEIAENAGYNSATYFSIAFKKFFGLSPTEYRKNELG